MSPWGCRLAAPIAGRRKDLEVGTSRARHHRLRTSQNIFRVIFFCFAGSLLIFHWGSLQSACFKGGQLSAALGLAFGFPSFCYNSFCGFKNR